MPRFPINQPSDLVKHYRHRAKKQLGQHFIVDPAILDALVEAAGVEEGDRVLEIGPGCGTLTWSLLQHEARVTAVELDRQAVEFLRDVARLDGDLAIVEGDMLSLEADEVVPADRGPWRCVSNLPYNAATEILFHLAPIFDRFEVLVLMFQREVADRLIARAGDDAFGRLSLMAHLHARMEIVKTLAPGAFIPAPRVHSAAVRFEPIAETRIPEDRTRRAFKEVVAAAFQKRRKQLPNALSGLDVDKDRLEDAIDAVGLDRTVRPERVAFDHWVALAAELADDV